MPLNKIQQRFTSAMFAPANVIEHPSEELAEIFREDDIPLPERLKIYRHHIILSLTEVLEETFPVVKILTGENFFRTMAKAYVQDNAPEEACLDRYGKTFADFIAGYEPASSLHYLADAARLDWAINESRCAADEESLTPHNLATLNPDVGTVIALKDSVRLIRSAHALDRIYEFCTKADRVSDETLDITGGPVCLMVARVGYDPRVIKLEKAEYAMLSVMAERKPLGEGLEAALKIDPAFNFVTFLQNYMATESFAVHHD